MRDDYGKPFRPFENANQWYSFCIGWNRETGRLLMQDERTRDIGLARLVEAERLEEKSKTIGEKTK